MIYMFLADGFEETEAITPLDILRRVGADVRTVSITKERQVKGSHGITVTADITVSEIAVEEIEMVVLPGGMPGTLNLCESEAVRDILRAAAEKDAYIAAICAAPRVLGKYGYLNGKTVTCYPGNEKYLSGARVVGARAVRDGKLITASGMGASFTFGIMLAESVAGRKRTDEVRSAVTALPLIL